MSAAGLPILAILATLLLALGVVSAMAGPRLAALGTILLCAIGAAIDLLYLATGAPAQTMSLPVGLPGQSAALALDGISGFFALLLLLAGTAASAASLDDHDPAPTAPALPVFLAAMLFTLLAADAVALVAGFELMSLASFILVLTHHRDAPVRAAGLLYYGMAAIGGLCLIVALALLSGHGIGFAAMRAAPPDGWRAACVLFAVVIGAGSKAGLAPLHLWLPPAHAAAPSPVSALMSGAMTKVALYVLVRILFDLCGPAQPLWWSLPLLAMGLASAVLGALRANLETDIKTILACSTIENVGLITIGLGLALAARAADLPALAALALGAALLHILAHGLFKTMLFLAAGSIQHAAGTRRLSRLGGLITAMPFTTAGMLLGAACLAGLPPGAGFAGEWMLFQSVIAAVRLGGLGLQIIVCVLAAGLALATALAAAAAVRLVGVALLGRPRSAEAAAARESGPPTRWALLLLGTLVALIGLIPGTVLGLAEPALRLLGNADLTERAGLLAITPHDHGAGYAPLGIVILVALAALLILAVLRAWAVAGHRVGPAWDCGFGAPPAWLPHGDPLTQYGGPSFSQPLRRVLGPALLFATQRVDMPEPGDTRPASFSARIHDPAEVLLFAPIGHLRARLSGLADRLQFLTVRQTLTVIFTALVGFLGVIALLEQL
jgi:formate hydrogenlyase subunit 3/multisubunit Na+/H+ antiporter MnhD subunit